MSSFVPINLRTVTPSNPTTIATVPSPRDASAKSDRGQRIKRELDTDPEVEENHSGAPKRSKIAEYFALMQSRSSEKSRSISAQRLPIPRETTPELESSIIGTGNHLESPELEPEYDRVSNSERVTTKSPTDYSARPVLSKQINPHSVPSVSQQPDTILKKDLGEPPRHSDALPEPQSALPNGEIEELDRATYCRLAYRETQKKVQLLKIQLLEERRRWKEEEDKKEAEEIKKLEEEQKSLSELLMAKEKRLAKLKRRSLKGPSTTIAESIETRNVRDSASDGTAHERLDASLLRGRKKRPVNDPSKGYYDADGWWIPHPGRNQSLREPSQIPAANRSGSIVEEMIGGELGALAGTENTASSNRAHQHMDRRQRPVQDERSPQTLTHPSNSHRLQTGPPLPLSPPSDASLSKPHSSEMAVSSESQPESGSLQGRRRQSGSIWSAEDSLSTAPSVSNFPSGEQAPLTVNADLQTSPQTSRYSLRHVNSHMSYQFSDPFENIEPEPIYKKKGKGQHTGKKFRRPEPEKDRRHEQYLVEKSRFPDLPADIPLALRKSDQELVQIGKIISGYGRHQGAPYAYTRQGKLRSEYFRLKDAVDEAGASVWTAQEFDRLRPSRSSLMPGRQHNRDIPAD